MRGGCNRAAPVHVGVDGSLYKLCTPHHQRRPAGGVGRCWEAKANWQLLCRRMREGSMHFFLMVSQVPAKFPMSKQMIWRLGLKLQDFGLSASPKLALRIVLCPPPVPVLWGPRHQNSHPAVSVAVPVLLGPAANTRTPDCPSRPVPIAWGPPPKLAPRGVPLSVSVPFLWASRGPPPKILAAPPAWHPKQEPPFQGFWEKLSLVVCAVTLRKRKKSPPLALRRLRWASRFGFRAWSLEPCSARRNASRLNSKPLNRAVLSADLPPRTFLEGR